MSRIIGPPQDVLDVVAEKVQDAIEARRLAESIFSLIDAKAEPLRNAATNGDRESQLFLGRLDLLRGQLHARTRRVPILTAAQAAHRLRLTKPDGTPRDSAYTVIERAGGRKVAGKWTITEDQLEAFIREGR